MSDTPAPPPPGAWADEEREFYQAAYDLSPVMMHSLDASGRLVYVNDHWLQVMGYSREEVIGQPGPSFLSEASRQYALRTGIPKTLAEGYIKEDPIEMIAKDGRVLHVLVSSVIARDADGRVVRSYAAIVDITQQKEAERDLSFRNTILNTQQEVSLDGILVVDMDSKIVSYNRRFAELWRLPAEVLAERDDPKAIEAALDQLQNPDQFLEKVTYLYNHPDESSFDELLLKDGRHFDRYSAPMLGHDGHNYGRVWFFRDNTRRKRIEAALRESEQRLASVIESAMDAIVAVDADRKVRVFNQAAEQVFGATAEESIGSLVDRFLSPSFSELLGRTIAGRAADPGESSRLWAPEGITAIAADGSEFPVEATLSQVELGSGTLTTMILRNVNERHQARAALARLQLQNLQLQEEISASIGYHEIVGESTAIRSALRQVGKVAMTDATVLINGETGTGKELIARAIHKESRRAEQALVAVNCAALPTGLIESELFGHEKGAFTGALSKKIGRFELADGGTLFLDEIGDLPLELQAKLLRVLQEGEFERLGSTETICVDVRLIAATHHNLQQAVAEKQFREDLFYRLNVVPIRLPPLRERTGDVRLLAKYFAALYAKKMGKRIDRLPQRVLDALDSYAWPGNVRELQNVIERAVILSDEELELGEWPPLDAAADHASTEQTLEEVERRHITAVLESAVWRVSGNGGAAERLGLKPSTLESRMKKLGIHRPKLGT